MTLLEAGQPISSPPGSHVRNEIRFQQDPDSYFAGIAGYFRYFDATAPPAGLPGASTTTAVGGQGVLWTNNCPRPAAFELWPVMPDAEWDRYLGDAERYLDVHDDTFDASVRQRCIIERLRIASFRRRPRNRRTADGGAAFGCVHDPLRRLRMTSSPAPM